MDYYYALLESYEQLKRRKFKLSLREAEGEADGDAAGIISQVGKGKTEDVPGELNGVEVWEQGAGEKEGGNEGEKVTEADDEAATPEKPKEVTFVGRWVGASFSVTLMKGPTINPNENDNAAKMISKLLGKKEDTTKDDTTKDDTTKDDTTQIVDPNQQELDAAEAKFSDFTLGAKGADGERTGGFLSPDNVKDNCPKYEPLLRESRVQKSWQLILGKVRGTSKAGEGIHGDQPPNIEDMVISSPNLDTKEAAVAINKATATMEIVKRLRQNTPPPLTAKQLREAAADIKVSRKGVQFNGVYMQFRSSSSLKNDPYRNVVGQLNAAINEHNEEYTEGTLLYKQNYVEPLLAKNPGRDLALRGPMLEHYSVALMLAESLDDCEKDKGGKSGRVTKFVKNAPVELPQGASTPECAEIRKKMEDQFTAMVGDGTMAEGSKILQAGICAESGQCLVNIQGADSAIIANQVEEHLTGQREVKDQNGNSTDPATYEDIPNYKGPRLERRIAQRLMLAAAQQGDGMRATAMIVASERGHGSFLDKLHPVDATVWGGTGSNLKGQKDDVRVTLTQDDLVKLKADLATTDPTKLAVASAAECAGEGVGANALGVDVGRLRPLEGQPEIRRTGDQVTVGMEQKNRNNTTEGRTKTGEGTNAKFNTRCEDLSNPDAPTPEAGSPQELEAKFTAVNNERLDGCQGEDQTYNARGKPKQTAQQAACAFNEGIKSTKTMTAWGALTGTDPAYRGVEGTEEGQSGAMLAEFLGSKTAGSKAHTDAQAKVDLANPGFINMKAGKPLSKEQQEAIDKIGFEFEQAEISKRLDDDTHDGVVTGESLGYLLSRMSEDSGSLNECVKDVRGYEDHTQQTGLINSTTYGTVGMVNSGAAVIRRKPGSNHYDIETTGTEPKTLMKGDFERGQLVSSVGEGSMKEEGLRNPDINDSIDPMIYQFLLGQQALLEKLMNQTT